MRKKCLIIIFTFLMALTLAVPAYASSPNITLDGNELTLDTPHIIDNGRTLVPMRAIFEALGAGVNWDGATNTVTASVGDTEIQLVIGGKAFKNGASVDLDVPAKLYEGRTMVPLRFVSEALGASVDWDGSTQTVIITSPSKADIPQPAQDPEEPAEPPSEPPADTGTGNTNEPASTGDTPFEQYLAGLEKRFVPEKAEGVSRTYQFVINKGHPGKYYVTIKDGLCTTGEGEVDSSTITITVGEQLWLDIAGGKVDGTVAYFTGKFEVDGNPSYVEDLSKFFARPE